MNHLIAGLIALAVILGATTHALALPIGIAIAGALGAVGTAATILGAVITAVVGVGLNILASALLKKKPASSVGGTSGQMQTGGVVPRSFPFGAKALVTHSLTYWNSFGQAGGTPNAYLAMEFALSDLPTGGGQAALVELWPNGSKATWNPSATPSEYGIPIPEFNKDGTDHMWVSVSDGTQTVADALLVSLFSGDSDRPYANTRIGTGIVKVRVICRVNDKLFSGFPSFKFVCKGVPLYDHRFDGTNGGSGSQRWSDKTTWVSGVENPMTVAYNVVRGVSYAGSWFFGGQTVGQRQLPSSAWLAAANECDVAIDLDGGGTEKQFRCAGEIRLDMEPADVLEDILRSCNGKLGETGGIYKPYAGAAGVAVLSITDDDIRTNEDQTFEPFFGLQDIINSVNAKYIEPGDGWVAKDAPALIDAGLEAEDGGRRQPVDLQYEYAPFGTQVQRLNKAALLDYRRERRHALPLAPEAFRLEPAVDFISWTSARNGYSSKLFEVKSVADMDNFMVGVSLKEVDPSDYDWDPATDEYPIILSPTPLVLVASQPIPGFDAEGVTISTASGVPKAGIRIEWNGADIDDVVGVEFQIWNSGLTAVVAEGITAPSTVPLGYAVLDGGVVSATTYKVRGRFVAGSARDTTWSDHYTVTTPDVRLTQDALDAALNQLITEAAERANQAAQDARDIIAALSGDDGQSQPASARLNLTIAARIGQMSQAVLASQAAIEDFRGVLGDLGWERIGPGGASRFRAIDTLASGLGTVTTTLNLLAGRVDFILAASTGDLSAIDSQLTTILSTLDAVEGLVETVVTDVNAADGQITTLQSRMSTVEDQIALLASTAEIDELRTLIEAAQLALSSGTVTAETIAGLQRTQEQIAEGVAGLIARMQGLTDTAFETAAGTRLQLSSQIDELGRAQARFDLELSAFKDTSEANLRDLGQAQASGLLALAARVLALETAVASPTTGLTATATALSALTTRVADTEDGLEASATQLGELTTTVGDLSVSVTEVRDATIDATGASAVWSLMLDVDGRVSGVKNLNTGETSVFVISADKFAIADPDTGEAKLYFDADTSTLVLKDGTIVAAVIKSADGRIVDDFKNKLRTTKNAAGEDVLLIGYY